MCVNVLVLVVCMLMIEGVFVDMMKKFEDGGFDYFDLVNVVLLVVWFGSV